VTSDIHETPDLTLTLRPCRPSQQVPVVTFSLRVTGGSGGYAIQASIKTAGFQMLILIHFRSGKSRNNGEIFGAADVKLRGSDRETSRCGVHPSLQLTNMPTISTYPSHACTLGSTQHYSPGILSVLVVAFAFLPVWWWEAV
jgi:hypothetical protein